MPKPVCVKKELDVVKLHANMCKNIINHKETYYEKKMCDIKQKLAVLDAEQLRIVKDKTADRRTIVPVVTDIRCRRIKLHKEMSHTEVLMRSDHLTDYLLQAIPMLNEMHKVNAGLVEAKNTNDETVLRQLAVDKSRIIDRYVGEFFPHLLKSIDSSRRTRQLRDFTLEKSKCCGAPVIQNTDSGLVCNECGLVIAETANIISNPSANISYNRNISPYKCYSYKRVNHLREYLRQITGKTMVNMCVEEMQRVRDEVAKQTIPIDRVNSEYVRRLLKRLKLNAHYEQATTIARMLNPKLDVLKLEPEYEERLVLQFVTLERPFERIREKVDKTRKNFLSYSYVFWRLNELNGRSHLNKDVRLLKSVRLIIKQDAFWKLICKELKWSYHGNSISV